MFYKLLSTNRNGKQVSPNISLSLHKAADCLPSPGLSSRRQETLLNITVGDCGNQWGQSLPTSVKRQPFVCTAYTQSSSCQTTFFKCALSADCNFFSFCLFYFAGFVIFLINVPKSPRGENDYSSIYPLFGNPEKYAYKLKSLKFDLFISKTISLALCIFTNSSCRQAFMFKIVEQLHCVCEFKIHMNSTVLDTHHNVCNT